MKIIIKFSTFPYDFKFNYIFKGMQMFFFFKCLLNQTKKYLITTNKICFQYLINVNVLMKCTNTAVSVFRGLFLYLFPTAYFLMYWLSLDETSMLSMWRYCGVLKSSVGQKPRRLSLMTEYLTAVPSRKALPSSSSSHSATNGRIEGSTGSGKYLRKH